MATRVDNSADKVLIQLHGQLDKDQSECWPHIQYSTTEEWNTKRDLITKKGTLYVYSDYATRIDNQGNTVLIPNFKFGDGTTPLIDAPFVVTGASDATVEEITQAVIDQVSSQIAVQVAASVIDQLDSNDQLVRQEDRENWDNKVTSSIDPVNSGNLVLSF